MSVALKPRELGALGGSLKLAPGLPRAGKTTKEANHSREVAVKISKGIYL